MTRFEYAPFYCEENIWWLARRPELKHGEVAILFNPDGLCVLFEQRAAEPGEPLGWDYHVVLGAAGTEGHCQVWDLDSRLGAPVAAELWFAASFPDVERWPKRYVPRFRLLSAAEYVASLSSDRSHMRRADGTYREPPPPWPAIGNVPANLTQLTDGSRSVPGELLELAQLRRRWRG